MGKKLIEVALPVDLINDSSGFDKKPSGAAHPKGIHQWWARLPLPAARSILFASLVDDPSCDKKQFPNIEDQDRERRRLFDIIKRLSQKKMHLHQEAFQEAYEEILKHCDGNLPTVLDPFSGGGSIPLESMRLGLPTFSSDLNPIAVLLNKVSLEILPKYKNVDPINPLAKGNTKLNVWERGAGLADDLRYYGNLINDKLKEKIGFQYPKVKHNGVEYKVITWLWVRTVKCPNPACGCNMPLTKSFILSSKKKPTPFSYPIINKTGNGNIITGYEVKYSGVPEIKSTIGKTGAICVACNEPVKLDYIRRYGRENGLGTSLIAIVADSKKGRVYLSPTQEHENIANSSLIEWKPETHLPEKALGFRVQAYGLNKHWQLFNRRQLSGITHLSDFISVIDEEIVSDGGSVDYSNALKVLLALALDRLVDFNCSLATWKNDQESQIHVFTKQTVSMVWDYPDANILEDVSVSWNNSVKHIARSIEVILTNISKQGRAIQHNASTIRPEKKCLISTDPPYYDNIGYSDLSDLFYIWLRKILNEVYPDLFSTIMVPKAEELVASEIRYGSKTEAKKHFEEGFKSTFTNFKEFIDGRFPLTVYYAFKQEEGEDISEEDEVSPAINLSTGWETLLEALVSSGFQITATWPIRASYTWRMRAIGSNALASYLVLVCRVRDNSLVTINRRQYLQELKRELPEALKVLQNSNLAPVDLAQASIGPGMAIFSKYNSVTEQDGSNMTVRTALSLINKSLGEILAEQEGDFDTETRWALAWFEQNEFAAGEFGDANALALAKNTAVNALVHSGVVKSGAGKVQLIPRSELSPTWDPTADNRVVVWEITQHLIKQLQEHGEIGAAKLYKKLGPTADIARELAYHLFTICEKKGWAQEAQAYNSLVLSWNQIVAESYNLKDPIGTQGKLEF